jgi:hypothetical protein
MMPIALGWPLISMLIAPVFMSSALWENLGPRELLAEAEKAIALVESYTAIFHKQELFDGVLNEEETISIKFKKPFCVDQEAFQRAGMPVCPGIQ